MGGLFSKSPHTHPQGFCIIFNSRTVSFYACKKSKRSARVRVPLPKMLHKGSFASNIIQLRKISFIGSLPQSQQAAPAPSSEGAKHKGKLILQTKYPFFRWKLVFDSSPFDEGAERKGNLILQAQYPFFRRKFVFDLAPSEEGAVTAGD